MTLSQEQINRLYEFTRQHYVEYYDLQMELVDHLANSIEEQWKENPKLSFETALNIEFKKFGIFGFTDMITQRRRTLQEKYNKIVRGYINDFFKPPIIIGMLAVIGILPFFVNIKYWDRVLIIVMVANLVLSFFNWIVKKIRQRAKKRGQKWLFEEVLKNNDPLEINIIIFVFYSWNHRYHFIDSILKIVPEQFLSLALSSIAVCFGLYVYVVGIVIPFKTKEYLKQTYPEYNLQEL